MANIKSAKKRISVINKKTAMNKSKKSAIKTAEKRFLEAIENNDLDEAKKRLTYFQKRMSRLGDTGLFHKNKASRKISRLSKKLNALQK